MVEFKFDTRDIDRAVKKMADADSNFIDKLDKHIKQHANNKSIYWKDYALGKRR